MKRFSTLCFAAVAGAAALLLQGCCCCCCRPAPCKEAPCGQKMEHRHGHRPCPGKKADKPRRPHPGWENAKKRMETIQTLREKHPDEMLAIDKEIIAAEDKVAALAAKDGLEMPKAGFDFRRVRVAFPEEMKKLDEARKTMKPGEYFRAVKELSKKLDK